MVNLYECYEVTFLITDRVTEEYADVVAEWLV